MLIKNDFHTKQLIKAHAKKDNSNLVSFTLSANTPKYFIFECVPSTLSNQPPVCELGDTDLVTGLYKEFILGPLTHNSINRILSDKLPIH